MPSPNLHTLVASKADEIENELKALNRWDPIPLPEEKFVSMGAFGSNTMSFVQWLQFVLIPAVRDIVAEKTDFPSESMLAPYAIREFDGDPNSGMLHELLYQLDALINAEGTGDAREDESLTPGTIRAGKMETISLGSEEIPSVVYTLAGLLPQFEGDELESQLQTYDTFLAVLLPAVRPVISDLLMKAAASTNNPVSKARIEKAAASVAQGGRAAEPYNHDEAMKKYMEEHEKSFLPQRRRDAE